MLTKLILVRHSFLHVPTSLMPQVGLRDNRSAKTVQNSLGRPVKPLKRTHTTWLQLAFQLTNLNTDELTSKLVQRFLPTAGCN